MKRVKRYFESAFAGRPAKMRCACALPMTPAAPDLPSPAAVTAFLRGLDRRARLFAGVQAGDAVAAQHALAVVGRVFTGEAGQWPIAEWPRHHGLA